MEDLNRIQKFIALSGYCSRRKAEELIISGKVKVNGKIANIGDKCSINDMIVVDGKIIKIESSNKKIYIVMDKPKGYVCSKSDKFNKKTIYDLILKKDFENNLFSVGRLDKDTTGLIIITNDGDFAQSIIHPSKKINKHYLVFLNRKLSEIDRKKIETGIIIDDYKLKKCLIENIEGKKYNVVISEGRKRQIRRMFELSGYEVVNLRRTNIGSLDIESINFKLSCYKLVSKEFLEKNIFA